MPIWNETFVQTLVTDSGTMRDGEKLARSGAYSGTGYDARSAWGLAKGSGKSPYQVSIDLNDTATKCSCPSRKFPCKHAVGLMLLLARGNVPTSAAPPAWTTTWLDGRERKRESTPAPAKAPDAAAQAKREAARLAKVTDGVGELRLFLEDLVRQGLSNPAVKSYGFWDRIAARMVDSQMQPIGRRLRALGGAPFQKKANWAEMVADEVGRLYALTEAYQRLDSLPELLAYDVRAALGFNLKQEDVLALGTSVIDRWQVLGNQIEQVEQLQERRTWLYGEQTGQYALILDFAHRSRPFDAVYPPAHWFSGEIVYYPSAYPQRAVVKSVDSAYTPVPQSALKLSDTVEDILNGYADALAVNPFLQYVPAGLQEGWATRSDLMDSSGRQLPLAHGAQPQWLNAVMGGDRLPIFGEWDGSAFLVAGLFTAEGWLPLGDA